MLRICRTCPVPHYENCEECFGFGVYEVDGRNVPIGAAQSQDNPPPNAAPCPMCKSTTKGIPR